MEETRIRVIATEDELQQIEELMLNADVTYTRLTPRAVDPGTVTLLIVGSIAAVATVQASIENFRGGQVIDLRPEAAMPFYRTRNLRYGLIAIIAVDGSLQIALAEPKDMFGQVMGLLEAVLRPGEPLSTQEIEARIPRQVHELEGVTVTAQLGVEGG